MAIVPQAGSSSDGTRFRDPLLAGVPEEARTLLWQGLLRAVEPGVWLWEQTPPGTQRHLPPPALEHFGERFNDAALPSQLMEHLRRLWRMQFLLAADLLEALLLEGASETYAPLFAACCTRIGQIYNEIKRRGGLFFALLVLLWEVKLLTYRDSPVLAPLLFEGRFAG